MSAAPDVPEIRRFVKTGLPIGGQWALGMLSFSLFSTLIARMGDASMAASQAFVQLLALSFMQMVGLFGDEIDLNVTGDGLIAHIIKTGAALSALEEDEE